jgi:hypothetical protein
MMDHVERKHLKGKDPDARIECCHPTCKSQGLILEHLQHFKNHVQAVHGIALRGLGVRYNGLIDLKIISVLI